MQNKDLHRFNIGLNKDDNPADLQPGEYTDALNMRVASSEEQQGIGIMETLQGEVELIITAIAAYYGGAIGGQFIYEGYEEIQIGNQVWMKSNWAANYPGSKVYGDIEANRAIYGGLYNYNQIIQSDFCPAGWHIPTETEVDELLTYLGGQMLAGGKMKESGIQHWLSPNTAADDSSRFTALPGGQFDIGSLFNLIGSKGLFLMNSTIDNSVGDGTFTLRTTKSGMFSITLRGVGDIIINWGDGVLEAYTLTGIDQTFTHLYPSGGTVTVIGSEIISKIISVNESITEANISNSCVLLDEINLSNNLLTSFLTYPEWVQLQTLNISQNNLSSIILQSAWINISVIDINDNNLNSFIGLSSWVNLTYLDLSSNELSTITTSVDWTQLSHLDLSDNNLLGIATYATWASLNYVDVSYNSLSSFALYEWDFSSAAANYINLSHNSISSITIPSTWISTLGTFDASFNTLSTIDLTYLRWFAAIYLQNNYITSFTYPAAALAWNYFYINNNQLTFFSLLPAGGAANLMSLRVHRNNLTSFALTATAINLRELDVSYNYLTSFTDHSEWGSAQPGFRDFSFYNNALNLITINDILINLDALVGADAWTTGDFLDLSGGTSAGPISPGFVAKNNLIAQGATILTNASTTLPGIPVALEETDVTLTGFTANWQAFAGATGYFFDLSRFADFSTKEDGYDNLDVGLIVTLPIAGLLENTTYYYRVRAYDLTGESVNSNVITAPTGYALGINTRGNGTGVTSMNLRTSGPVVLTISGAARFYSDPAGTLDENTTWNVNGATTLYMRCPVGTGIITFSNPALLTILGGYGGGYVPGGSNSPTVSGNPMSFVNLTEFEFNGGNIFTIAISDIPATMTRFIFNGTNLTGNLSQIPPNIVSFYCYGPCTVTGDVADIPASVTGLIFASGSNTIYGDIADIPVGIFNFQIEGLNTLSGDIGDLSASMYYFKAFGNNTITGNVNTLSAPLAYLLLYGSNTITGDINDIPASIIIFNVSGNNTLSGDISNLKAGLNSFYADSLTNTIAGSINALPPNLAIFNISNNGVAITGDVVNLPATMTTLYVRGDNTITGDVANLPAGLTGMRVEGQNTIYGDIADLPVGLTLVDIYGATTVTGDLNDLPPLITVFRIVGLHTISTYTAGHVWANYMYAWEFSGSAGGNLSSGEVDNLLIDMSLISEWNGLKILSVAGLNAARTAASDAAVAILQGKGVTVTTN